MGGRRRRSRVEPTDNREQLALLCKWPEQLAYEEIRPLTLFGASVAERARETGSAERTLYRKSIALRKRAWRASSTRRRLDAAGYRLL